MNMNHIKMANDQQAALDELRSNFNELLDTVLTTVPDCETLIFDEAKNSLERFGGREAIIDMSHDAKIGILLQLMKDGYDTFSADCDEMSRETRDLTVKALKSSCQFIFSAMGISVSSHNFAEDPRFDGIPIMETLSLN
jgi:hypothetical protein